MYISLTSTANIRGAVITLSHSPCKPGSGLLQKQQQKSISGAPGTTNPQKKQPPIVLFSLRKKESFALLQKIKKELNSLLLSKVVNT